MPQTTLSSLPLEVHFDILKYALYSSQNWAHVSGNTDWVEEDKRDLSQFPYNAAAVCQLWHAVLTKIPECWTRVIIDIATDPSRFLDIFLWSKDLPNLEVTVFNSHTPDLEDVEYTSLERERISAIVNAIRPHISRCKYIAFDIALLTSLPSPIIFLLEDNPYLEELYLKCKIENGGCPEEYSQICDLGVSEPIQKCSLLPALLNLSMTGFWFMFIAGHPYTSEWFQTTMKTGAQYDVQQIITRFQFQKDGQYTLQNLIRYISELDPKSMVLRHISLNHEGPILNRTKSHDMNVFCMRDVMAFENVSADVLQTLFSLADVSPEELTFDKCTFPNVALPSRSPRLCLSNIPRSSTGPNSPRNTSNIGSILKDWSGYSLVVDSCPSFDDDALSVLAGHKGPTLEDFELSNCGNFTVHGIQQYLKKRNQDSDETTDTPGYEPLECLDVDSAYCPFLSEEDKEWFSTSEYASATDVYWVGRDPESDAELQKFYNADS